MRAMVRRAAIAALVLSVAAAAPIGAAAQASRTAPVLRTLHGVDELRAAFNRDAGQVRILLLLSPT